MQHINPKNKVPSPKWGNCMRQNSVSQTLPSDGTLKLQLKACYVTSCMCNSCQLSGSAQAYLSSQFPLKILYAFNCNYDPDFNSRMGKDTCLGSKTSGAAMRPTQPSYSPQTCVSIKNEQSYISAPPKRLHGVEKNYFSIHVVLCIQVQRSNLTDQQH